MEDVRKHINHAPPLSNDHTTLPITTTNSTFQPFTLTIAIDPPPAIKTSSSSTSPLVTVLNLNSHHSHKELQSVRPHQYHNNTPSKVEAFGNTNPFQNLPCSFGSLSTLGREVFVDSDGKSGDRRRKRMMKNRESAARSRARKQAYTFELQQKVKQLLEENARLKRQQQELCEIEACQQKRKHNLYRTSTAPF